MTYVYRLFEQKSYNGTEYTFNYTGNEKVFTPEYTGYYKLEVWGAQGGSTNGYTGGYGGYSTGKIKLDKNQKIYINIGGKGTSSYGQIAIGGYNGGGDCRAYASNSYCGSGGGATHISFNSGKLSQLVDKKNSIIIVAGGGGGAAYTNSVNYGHGGHGGGYIGGSAVSNAQDFNSNGYGLGGTQTTGGCRSKNDRCGTFGLGYSDSTSTSSVTNTAGGGGGYYGGGGTWVNSAGGGSGYIGNPLLEDKEMYCYSCTISNNVDTLTYSTNESSTNPEAKKAKQENGYVKITFIGQIYE